MKLKCPNCGSEEVYSDYSGDVLEEDLTCGVCIVEYACECEECEKTFNCTVHYAVADINYA